MKKIGNWLLCLTPMLMTVAVQIIAAMFYTIIYIIIFRRPVTDTMPALLLSHLLTAFVAFISYYPVFGRKYRKNPISVFSARTWVTVAAAALGLQALVQFAFAILSELAPAWIEAYSKMIEQSGVGDLTVLSTVATLLLAPIGEELVFRGLTYKYFRRAGACAVAANVLQAALFGIMHIQPLQIAYAVVLGLVLGYLYEKYDSIYVPIVMHCIFNFLGTYGIFLLQKIEQEINLTPAFFIVGIISSILGMVIMKSDIKIRKTEEKPGE